MKQMKLICTLLFLVFLAHGQKEQLRVGDKVPNVIFNHVLYHPTRSATLSDFKGKLVILDFWSSWCGACISLMPHMDSLQKKFGSQIQILLVNQKSKEFKDDEEKIKKIIEHVKDQTGKQLNLPVVFNCSELDQFFPAKFLPHEVWINKEGKVEAITSSIEVNENNISKYLQKGKLSLHTKTDNFQYDVTKPLFFNGNGGSANDFKFHSILTGFKEGLGIIGPRANPNNANEFTGYTLTNVSLPQIVSTVFTKELNQFPNNRRMFEFSDSDKFREHGGDSLRYQYSYCYDITVPPTSWKKLTEYMQQDIERYFGITLKYKKSKMKCLVFLPSNKMESVSTKYDTRDADYEDYDGALLKKKYFHSFSIHQILSILDSRFDMPVIDETGISDKKIDIDFPDNFDLTNQQAVINFLKSIGFEIKGEERELDVVVITDK